MAVENLVAVDTIDEPTTVIDIRDARPDDLAGILPAFATAMRGYDRGQVDDFIERLVAFQRDAERRATLAEDRVQSLQRRCDDLSSQLSHLSKQKPAEASGYDALGARVSEIMRLAEEEAAQIREAAQSEAEVVIVQAKKHAKEATQNAERELLELTRCKDTVRTQLRQIAQAVQSLASSHEQKQRG